MPIRGFDKIRIGGMSALRPFLLLKNSIVAIDGFWFVKRYILKNDYTRVLSHGVENICENVIRAFCEQINKNNVQVLWIWDGIKINKDYYQQIDAEGSYAEGCMHYFNKDKYKASFSWRKWLDMEQFVLSANKLLSTFSDNVTVIRAPYTAMAQMVYFYKMKACDYIYGPNDLLLFENTGKIITEFDFLGNLDVDGKNKCNTYNIELTYKDEILKAYKLEFTAFKNYGFLLGCEFCPTFPEYATNFNIQEIFYISRLTFPELKERLNIYYNNDAGAILTETYIENYKRAQTLVRNQPIISMEGKLQFLHLALTNTGIVWNEQSEKKFEYLFGLRLPNACYEKLFIMKIIPDVLEILNKKDYKISNLPEIKELCENIKQYFMKGDIKRANDVLYKCIGETNIKDIMNIFFNFLKKRNILNEKELGILSQAITYKKDKNNFIDKEMTKEYLLFIGKISPWIKYFNLLISFNNLLNEENIEFISFDYSIFRMIIEK
ncbi:hypothetical protein SLOPH_1684 [Spraguea lophii 42_110]|uniref:Uncharacterized protein n=1 Tax=Spraguea lophii (strain 42_110) TaxID=1358809 RepID=S7W907_SPRLO|nr:hypothetical protein SLOPH_1684 [Spraguea lophii 42_110]